MAIVPQQILYFTHQTYTWYIYIYMYVLSQMEGINPFVSLIWAFNPFVVTVCTHNFNPFLLPFYGYLQRQLWLRTCMSLWEVSSSDVPTSMREKSPRRWVSLTEQDFNVAFYCLKVWCLSFGVLEKWRSVKREECGEGECQERWVWRGKSKRVGEGEGRVERNVWRRRRERVSEGERRKEYTRGKRGKRVNNNIEGLRTRFVWPRE